jgi:hypothetical protein
MKFFLRLGSRTPRELGGVAVHTIRVFCGCNSTPSCFRIRSAATAARASAADLQVITRGVAPGSCTPRLFRIGREPLDSYRSHQGASPHAHSPVSEQRRSATRNTCDPVCCTTKMTYCIQGRFFRGDTQRNRHETAGPLPAPVFLSALRLVPRCCRGLRNDSRSFSSGACR